MDEKLEVNTLPVTPCGDTKGVAWSTITNDTTVTRLLNGIVTEVHFLVTIEIVVLDVSRAPSLRAECRLVGVRLDLCLALEETVRLKAPYLTQLLSYIVSPEELLRVIKLGDLRLIIREYASYVIGESITELISPRE